MLINSPANVARFLLLNKTIILSNNKRFYPLIKMTSDAKWKMEKDRILRLPIEAKRKLYKSSFVKLHEVDPWNKYFLLNKVIGDKKPTIDDLNEFRSFAINVSKNKNLQNKVSIFKGDITKLEVDAIVNAANSRLIAGGGVDGAIHRAAGPLLQRPFSHQSSSDEIHYPIVQYIAGRANWFIAFDRSIVTYSRIDRGKHECNSLGGCPTGEARITSGYSLPAKYVIHTVGPQDGSAPKLRSCYENCLNYVSEYNLQSIAFPCISTGIYGFPNRLAAHIALKTARIFLENNKTLERIIFCTFLPVDVEIYEILMQLYFPVNHIEISC